MNWYLFFAAIATVSLGGIGLSLLGIDLTLQRIALLLEKREKRNDGR